MCTRVSIQQYSLCLSVSTMQILKNLQYNASIWPLLFAVLAFQQLDQLTDGKALLGSNGVGFALIVASFNALVWTAMIVFAFVQVCPFPPPPQSLYSGPLVCSFAGLQSDWCRTHAEEGWGEKKDVSFQSHSHSEPPKGGGKHG